MHLCLLLCLLSSHFVASCGCGLCVYYPYPDLVLVYVVEDQTASVRWLVYATSTCNLFGFHGPCHTIRTDIMIFLSTGRPVKGKQKVIEVNTLCPLVLFIIIVVYHTWDGSIL